ncbi:hypothetical protein CAPTEDRAFT_195011 [Capitella teleta]|uniref:Uncharacterized protein n=1 Tax=Capitella teleta TaxID=283909 RepID=R7U2L1_CAPTE|nr:hypothetical protein CAPTEDRAFT_195011 [Capitella teleta]|eukprot:ELU00580.1 hypothetical protein CAPTEDRAFT_195011 [Capitella teleta]
MAEEVSTEEQLPPPPPPEIRIQDGSDDVESPTVEEESAAPQMAATSGEAVISDAEVEADKHCESDADVFAKSPSQDSFVPSLSAKAEPEGNEGDSGYERLDDTSDDNVLSGDEQHPDLKSPPMPRPPPPSPAPHKAHGHLEKTSSSSGKEDEESDGADVQPEGQGVYQSFGDEEVEEDVEEEEGEEEGEDEDEDDEEDDEEYEYGVQGEEDDGDEEEEDRGVVEEEPDEEVLVAGGDGTTGEFTLAAEDKITIVLPGRKSKPKKPPPPSPAEPVKWVNFEEEDDGFGFVASDEAPPRPGAPPRPKSRPAPKRPAPPNAAKPSRPPPPKPAPPSGGPPRRPPPPSQKQPTAPGRFSLPPFTPYPSPSSIWAICELCLVALRVAAWRLSLWRQYKRINEYSYGPQMHAIIGVPLMPLIIDGYLTLATDPVITANVEL